MRKKVAIGLKPAKGGREAASADQWVASGNKAGEQKMKRFTIDVPEALHRRIKLQCAAQGLKMADEIRSLLDRHFPPKAVE